MLESSLLIKVILSLVGAWFGIVEYRLRKMNEKLENMYTKDEINDRIDIKQEAIKEKIDNLKEGQDEIKDNVNYIKKELVKLASRSLD